MSDPRKDRNDRLVQDPAREGERPAPRKGERGPGQGYGNTPGLDPGFDDVESWHQETPPPRRR